MKLSEIEEAGTDRLYAIDFPVTTKEGEEKLRVEYRALTPERLAIPGLPASLAAIVASIKDGEEDLQADDGGKFELTEENLAGLGMRFLNRLSKAVADDYFPK